MTVTQHKRVASEMRRKRYEGHRDAPKTCNTSPGVHFHVTSALIRFSWRLIFCHLLSRRGDTFPGSYHVIVVKPTVVLECDIPRIIFPFVDGTQSVRKRLQLLNEKLFYVVPHQVLAVGRQAMCGENLANTLRSPLTL